MVLLNKFLNQLNIIFQLSVYLNNEHMTEDERMQLSVTNENFMYCFVVFINDVLLSDSGTLTFVAFNEFGCSQTTVNLIVESGEPN